MLPNVRRVIVLVVEDDKELRELYRSTLTIAGYVVPAVEDGLDALRLIDQGVVPSAMVLDIGLPRLGGQDVAREFRAHVETRSIPIVVVTGSDTDVDEREFSCVLRKPLTPQALVDAVVKSLHERRTFLRTSGEPSAL
jgi:CheY-like chemotaxis protein